MRIRFSPSSINNIARCPSFVFDIAKSTQSAMDAGTSLHKACETGDTRGFDKEETEWIDFCLDAVDMFIKDNEEKGDPIDYKEEKIVAPNLFTGYFDRYLVWDNYACVIDYKFTREAQTEAEFNWQLKAYAYAIMATTSIKEVTAVIIAPKVQQITAFTWTYDIDFARLKESLLSLKGMVGVFRNPCEVCSQCARGPKCPELVATFKELYKDEKLELPSCSNIEFAPIEDRGKFQKLADVASKWADRVKKDNNEFVSAGGELPGYKQINNGGRYSVQEPLKLWYFLRRHKLKLASFLDTCNVSLSKVKKIVPDLGMDTAETVTLLDDREIVSKSGGFSYLKPVKNKEV